MGAVRQTWCWLWTELQRPRRLPRATRGVRGRARSSRSGIALLLVISIIALLTVLVTEVVHGARVRVSLAAAQRDEAKAEALANGGVQFYRLLLIASKQLEGSGLMAMAAQYGIPLNANTLWQLVPKINSQVMRMLLLTDGDVDEAQERGAQGKLTDEERAEAAEMAQTSLKKAFLDFDGDFEAEVKDEDQRISIRSLRGGNMAEIMSDPHAGLLASLMSGERQDEYLRSKNLEKWELIANLCDWTDPDDQRLFDGGTESSVYENLDEDEAPYRPKNAAFDTLEEIRLVDGWNRDAIWQRYGQHLTIYGTGKINVNTADRRVMEAVLQRFIMPPPNQDSMNLIWQQIQAFRNTPVTAEGGGGFWHDPSNFVAFLREIAPGTVDDGLAAVLSVSSNVFRVRSSGEVGEANVTVTAVFEFPQGANQQRGGQGLAAAFGKVLYWHVE
jgi:type II secretory pathway component PulK